MELNELRELENIIGYRFGDKALLIRAMTHSSYANEKLGDPSLGNERLEFLGDAVLGACVGLKLFNTYRDKSEGSLTKMRAAVVCERSLGSAGKALGINRFLLLSKGEASSGGRQRVSTIADCMEAIIGAAYLDGGFEAANGFVCRALDKAFVKCAEGKLLKDSKTALQEILSHTEGYGPETGICYEIEGEEGPDHRKVFTAAVYVNGRRLGEGRGQCKKAAEQDAAKEALEVLAAER